MIGTFEEHETHHAHRRRVTPQPSDEVARRSPRRPRGGPGVHDHLPRAAAAAQPPGRAGAGGDRPAGGAVPATIAVLDGVARVGLDKGSWSGSRARPACASWASATCRSPRRRGRAGRRRCRRRRCSPRARASGSSPRAASAGCTGSWTEHPGRVGRPRAAGAYPDHRGVRGREVDPGRAGDPAAAGDAGGGRRRVRDGPLPRLLPVRLRASRWTGGRTPAEVPRRHAGQDALGGPESALIVANPVPEDEQLDPALHDRVLAEALDAAAREGVTGQAITPFLLGYLVRGTDGASLEANLAAVRGNVGSRRGSPWPGRGRDRQRVSWSSATSSPMWWPCTRAGSRRAPTRRRHRAPAGRLRREHRVLGRPPGRRRAAAGQVGYDSSEWHTAELVKAGVRPHVRVDADHPTAVVIAMVDGPASDPCSPTGARAGTSPPTTGTTPSSTACPPARVRLHAVRASRACGWSGWPWPRPRRRDRHQRRPASTSLLREFGV